VACVTDKSFVKNVAIGVGDGAIEVDEEFDVVEGTDNDEDEDDEKKNGHDLIPFRKRVRAVGMKRFTPKYTYK
jgi:hypothetical protein